MSMLRRCCCGAGPVCGSKGVTTCPGIVPPRFIRIPCSQFDAMPHPAVFAYDGDCFLTTPDSPPFVEPPTDFPVIPEFLPDCDECERRFGPCQCEDPQPSSIVVTRPAYSATIRTRQDPTGNSPEAELNAFYDSGSVVLPDTTLQNSFTCDYGQDASGPDLDNPSQALDILCDSVVIPSSELVYLGLLVIYQCRRWLDCTTPGATRMFVAQFNIRLIRGLSVGDPSFDCSTQYSQWPNGTGTNPASATYKLAFEEAGPYGQGTYTLDSFTNNTGNLGLFEVIGPGWDPPQTVVVA